MNAASRGRWLLTVVIVMILIGALAACDPQKSFRQGEEAGQRTFGLRCQFKLNPVTREAPAGKDGRVKMKELLGDTDKAFTYVNHFWQSHWHQCFDFDYRAPMRVANVQTGYHLVCGDDWLESDNAAYCPGGNWVAIGVDAIKLGEKRGDMVPYVTVAHELGHGVQAQLLGTATYSHFIEKPHTKAYELQADCLAGAALAGSAQEEGGFTWQDHDAQEVNATYEKFGDLESVNNPTHGDATERVAHFEQGREGGVVACFKRL